MPHLISNLYEKAYTPYTARLAPKNLWSRPQLGKYFPSQISVRVNVFPQMPKLLDRSALITREQYTLADVRLLTLKRSN